MKKNKKISKSNVEKKQKDIVVNYVKTNNYRSYHIDGMFGGLTPNGKVYADLFLQRSVTPQTIKYKVDDGIIKEELERTDKEGIVREIEAGIIMDIETAKIFREWLNTKINEYEQLVTDKKGKK